MQSYDGKIEWEAFYRARLGKPKKSGGKITGLCPFHDNTRTPAFWANLENGLAKCEAGCGDFNPTTFLARLEGISTAEANAKLLEMAGVSREKAAPKPAGPYTVATYAAEKHLDPAKLAEWGLADYKRGAGCVTIPYRDIAGEIRATRKRFAPGAEQRFAWAKGSSLILYGEWLLPTFGDDETIALVEGESDCHALWSLGIPALGVPGAGTFRPEWAANLRGRSIALHDEGDDGAKFFIARTTEKLAEAGFEGTVSRWSTPGEFKDPSEMYKAGGEKCAEPLRAAISAGDGLEVAAAVGKAMLVSRGLVCPSRWHISEDGLARVTDEGDVRLVTATPVIISRRIVDAGGAGERIELAFLRDGKWRTVVADRDQAFATRNIVTLLAPLGAHITSENAKSIVKWLGDLEAANLGKLATARSSSALGWCGSQFMPVDPGDIVLDLDESSTEIVAAFDRSGDYEIWLEAMRRHRDISPVFRFMLASAFAAPMLKAVRGRILFVYNWGASKGGKTAAVKASLSVWGDPTILMTTFNATTVGLERLATLMRDLPLGIDERQMAGGDQKRLDQIVYTLASGTGRVRGARDGGLQTTTHWRTLVLATGEEPLSGSTSQTGVSTRVLELFGVPFTSEDDAAQMHSVTSEHYGHAGPKFIAALKDLGDEKVREMHEAMLERIGSYGSTRASSHLSGVALITVADALISQWLFGADEKSALLDAQSMAVYALSTLEDAAAGDVDEAAAQWLEGWLRSNHARFEGESYGPVYGDVVGDVYRVLSSVLREAIEGAGFSYKKTMRALDGRGAVVDKSEKAMSSVARIHGKPSRVISLDVGVLLGERAGVVDALPF